MLQKDYKIFFSKLKDDIISARQKAYQAVNKQLVELYLRIGKRIYEKVEVSKWGEGIVETLANDLKIEFPDMKGFSKENLWRMKRLTETYIGYPKLSTLLTELSWSHNVLILNDAKSIEEKEFYIKSCVTERWSFRELQRWSE